MAGCTTKLKCVGNIISDLSVAEVTALMKARGMKIPTAEEINIVATYSSDEDMVGQIGLDIR